MTLNSFNLSKILNFDPMSSLTYTSLVSSVLIEEFSEGLPLFLFGENINQGSYLSGMARGLDNISCFSLLNVGNCELTHVGLGFGSLIDGGRSILLVKQLDFLLLSLDQIVNTYNWIRAYVPPGSQGSFTIYSLICDQGFQGPQSSLNNASDFASLANIDVYCMNTVSEINDIVRERFVSSGFRIVCLSQRFLGSEPINPDLISRSSDYSTYQYLDGSDITILCYNFTLRSGLGIANELSEHGFSCSLFHVNYIPTANLDLVIKSCSKTNKLLVIDDSKSVSSICNYHISKLLSIDPQLTTLFLTRKPLSCDEYSVNCDSFAISVDDVLTFIKSDFLLSCFYVDKCPCHWCYRIYRQCPVSISN